MIRLSTFHIVRAASRDPRTVVRLLRFMGAEVPRRKPLESDGHFRDRLWRALARAEKEIAA